MNQQIIDYLQQNKNAYSKEALIQKLRTSGYVEGDIQEAVNVVYGVSNVSSNFSAPAPTLSVVTNHKSSGCLKAVMISGAILFLIPTCLMLMIGHPYRHVDGKKSDNYYYNIIGNVHYVSGGNWLELGDDVVVGVDKKTFQIINKDYAKDKNYVYYKEQKIKNADPSSATILEYPRITENGDQGTTYFVKDAKMIYYKSFSFQDLDINSVQFLEGSYGHILKDKKHVFAIYDDSFNEYYNEGNGIYAQNMDYSIPPIEDADEQSFQAINFNYAYDKNNAYSYGILLPGSDGKTFSAWGELYAKDKNQVYCNREVLNADSETFDIIDNENYARDKNNVYLYCKVIAGADPETFKLIKEAEYDENKLLSKKQYTAVDKTNYYLGYEAVAKVE